LSYFSQYYDTAIGILYNTQPVCLTGNGAVWKLTKTDTSLSFFFDLLYRICESCNTHATFPTHFCGY